MALSRAHTFAKAADSEKLLLLNRRQVRHTEHREISCVLSSCPPPDRNHNPPHPGSNPNVTGSGLQSMVSSVDRVPPSHELCDSRLSNFTVILQTNKPTNNDENIVSLTEVIKQ